MRLKKQPKEITKELKLICTCNVYKWKKHECVYDEEVNWRNEPHMCACCPYCADVCAYDI